MYKRLSEYLTNIFSKDNITSSLWGKSGSATNKDANIVVGNLEFLANRMTEE